jgi:hypothetical protein
VLKPFRKGTIFVGRLVQVGAEWMISGASAAYPASYRDEMLAVAAKQALRHPRLVFRNPDKLTQARQAVDRHHRVFMELFGTDLVVVPGDFEWMGTWAIWWSRHCFRSAREGGLFPDLYLRRYRDKLEFSTGADPLPGIPDSYVFLTPNRIYHADPVDAAGTLFQVMSAAIQELCRRMPSSERLTDLDAKRKNLTLPGRETARMAWLAGLGNQIDKFRRVADEISATLRDAPEIIGSAACKASA